MAFIVNIALHFLSLVGLRTSLTRREAGRGHGVPLFALGIHGSGGGSARRPRSPGATKAYVQARNKHPHDPASPFLPHPQEILDRAIRCQEAEVQQTILKHQKKAEETLAQVLKQNPLTYTEVAQRLNDNLEIEIQKIHARYRDAIEVYQRDVEESKLLADQMEKASTVKRSPNPSEPTSDQSPSPSPSLAPLQQDERHVLAKSPQPGPSTRAETPVLDENPEPEKNSPNPHRSLPSLLKLTIQPPPGLDQPSTSGRNPQTKDRPEPPFFPHFEKGQDTPELHKARIDCYENFAGYTDSWFLPYKTITLPFEGHSLSLGNCFSFVRRLDGLCTPWLHYLLQCARHYAYGLPDATPLRNLEQALRNAPSPMRAWDIIQEFIDPRTLPNFEKKDWVWTQDAKGVEVLYRIMQGYFLNHRSALRDLMDTGTSYIDTTGPYEPLFTFHPSQPGQGGNWFGIVLMLIREETWAGKIKIPGQFLYQDGFHDLALRHGQLAHPQVVPKPLDSPMDTLPKPSVPTPGTSDQVSRPQKSGAYYQPLAPKPNSNTIHPFSPSVVPPNRTQARLPPLSAPQDKPRQLDPQARDHVGHSIRYAGLVRQTSTHTVQLPTRRCDSLADSWFWNGHPDLTDAMRPKALENLPGNPVPLTTWERVHHPNHPSLVTLVKSAENPLDGTEHFYDVFDLISLPTLVQGSPVLRMRDPPLHEPLQFPPTRPARGKHERHKSLSPASSPEPQEEKVDPVVEALIQEASQIKDQACKDKPAGFWDRIPPRSVPMDVDLGRPAPATLPPHSPESSEPEGPDAPTPAPTPAPSSPIDYLSIPDTDQDYTLEF